MLADGVDLVVLSLGGVDVPPSRARAVAARARKNGTILAVTDGRWPRPTFSSTPASPATTDSTPGTAASPASTSTSRPPLEGGGPDAAPSPSPAAEVASKWNQCHDETTSAALRVAQ